MQAIWMQTANCGLQVGNKRDHPIPHVMYLSIPILYNWTFCRTTFADMADDDGDDQNR